MVWPVHFIRVRRMARASVLVLGLGLAAGCHHCKGFVCDGAGNPAVNTLEPPGSFVKQQQEVQAAKAEASDFVIYLDEWYMDGDQLGPKGQAHLISLIPRLDTVPFPLLIQPHPNIELNEKRRGHVVAYLRANGVELAEERVILAFPQGEGLYGDEAPRIYNEMLQPHFGYGYGGGVFGRAGIGTGILPSAGSFFGIR